MRRPRHAELFAATESIHRATEDIVERSEFLSDRSRYCDYIRRMHWFYSRFARAADSCHATQVAAWRIPQRVVWLEEDLCALGIRPVAEAPTPCNTLDLSAPASVLGGLYVLVGSTLGAPILLKRSLRLDLPGTDGRAYLTGIAAERCWTRFLTRLEAEPASSSPQLVAGAVSTFECLLAHLSGAMA